MSLAVGQQLELSVEKPAAGGRMIARYGGQVVLVHGGIPGEQVLARVQRVERQLAFAETVQVLVPSADRLDTPVDLSCGGCLYAHVAYPRQLVLKAEVIRDAFARLGRIPLGDAVRVAPSPERGYRMRARLHVRGGRVGFYREGTHELCDPLPTGQLTEEAFRAAANAVASLERSGCPPAEVELSENIAADERALHVTAASGVLTSAALAEAVTAGGLSGCSGRGADGRFAVAGTPVVKDPLSAVTPRSASTGFLQRHAESFFQANRFLLPQLVGRVLQAVPESGEVLDLYAGVGLFSVALAAAGRERITAVEGDRSSGSDLQQNAAPFGGAVQVRLLSVEEYLRRRRGRPAATVIVDPPRTGISRDAMQAVARYGAARVVYVSCDPATMARDARRLLDAGYRMTSVEAFDLFPNTPHVEALGIFDI